MWNYNQRRLLIGYNIRKTTIAFAITVIVSVVSSCASSGGGKLGCHIEQSEVTNIGIFARGWAAKDPEFDPLIRTGQSNDKVQCASLYESVMKSDFRKRFVTNWDPEYYVIFRDSRMKTVCAIECNDDSFRFVKAKKGFWLYHVGSVIPVRDDKESRGHINGFKKTVLRLAR